MGSVHGNYFGYSFNCFNFLIVSCLLNLNAFIQMKVYGE